MDGVFSSYINSTGLLSARTELVEQGSLCALVSKLKSVPISHITGLIVQNDMRGHPHHRTNLFNRQPFPRFVRQQCYTERIREDGSNWRWYYHLAREMAQNNLTLVNIEDKTFTSQELVLKAIAINPNECCNWKLLSQIWPSNQETIRIAIEGGEAFCFTKKDAIAIIQELDTSRHILC